MIKEHNQAQYFLVAFISNMLTQREKWKHKFQETIEEIMQLPFVKAEFDKSTFKTEFLTEKYRDICIDMHTRSFIQDNTVSQVLGLDINNPDDFHDCTMISTQRVDHAILTGLSTVCVHKKTNKVLFFGIYFDEYDLPPPIDASKFRSKSVKLRNALLEHFEHNDNWINQIHKEKSRLKENYGFGKVRFGSYGAKNPNIDIESFGFTFYSINLLRQLNYMCTYKLGYDYIYGLQAHTNTLLYAIASDNAISNMNNYKNVDYNCQGYSKVTSQWNFSKHPLFVEYINGKKLIIDDNLCWLGCAAMNIKIIRDIGWDLEKYWNWSVYQIAKKIVQEFVRLKQKRETMIRKQAKQIIISKL